MASNNELNRMIYHVEGAISRINNSLLMLPSLFHGKREDLDPDTGLRKDFLQLKRRQSLLIEISTNLAKQQLEIYRQEVMERRAINGKNGI